MNKKRAERRIRRRVGDIICVPLGEGKYGFGRVLEEATFAFYDLESNVIPAMTEVLSARVIFKIPVMDYAVTSGRWPIMGHAILEPELRVAEQYFMEDSISGQFSIYQKGAIRPATLVEVKDLEAAAVWEPHHVEERLRDHFAGIPNATREWLRPGRNPAARPSKPS